jgi:hypothetical protein
VPTNAAGAPRTADLEAFELLDMDRALCFSVSFTESEQKADAIVSIETATRTRADAHGKERRIRSTFVLIRTSSKLASRQNAGPGTTQLLTVSLTSAHSAFNLNPASVYGRRSTRIHGVCEQKTQHNNSLVHAVLFMQCMPEDVLHINPELINNLLDKQGAPEDRRTF